MWVIHAGKPVPDFSADIYISAKKSGIGSPAAYATYFSPFPFLDPFPPEKKWPLSLDSLGLMFLQILEEMTFVAGQPGPHVPADIEISAEKSGIGSPAAYATFFSPFPFPDPFRQRKKWPLPLESLVPHFFADF